MEKKKVRFVTKAEEDAEEIPSIFIDDGWGWQEVFPEQLEAYFSFKAQVEYMSDGEYTNFTTVVEDARNLRKSFMKCVRLLKPQPAE